MSGIGGMNRFWFALHALTLNAFVLLQPMLAKLQANLSFVRYEGYSASVVITVIATLGLALPLLAFLTTSMAAALGRQGAEVKLRAGFIWFWFLLGMLILMRWCSTVLRQTALPLPEWLLSIPAVLISLLLLRWYDRTAAFRQIISLASIGAVLFPVIFFASPVVSEVVFRTLPVGETAQPAVKPAPVIFLVFDGMTGMSLLNEKYEVDGARYPGFGRLASMSTYFRNATTVHPRTDHALPAMLSSCYPKEEWTPVAEQYPANLFRSVWRTQQYDMTIFEPLTRLCPEQLKVLDQYESESESCRDLISTLLLVYANLILPQDVEIVAKIPRKWFGLVPENSNLRRQKTGHIAYPWDGQRMEQADHFVSSLKNGPRPLFSFLHIAIPHYPWSLLPDGRSYLPNARVDLRVIGMQDELWSDDEWPVNQAWQRNLLQIQAADQLVLRVLQQLETEGVLKDALIVVTADHGMAFVPGRQLRDVSADSLPDLISVPLFIKLPGQTSGSLDDRNVETIDIVPTIAEVIGLPSQDHWEGQSVFQGSPRNRKRVTGFIDTILEPDFPARFRHTDRLVRIFGSGSSQDKLGMLSTDPELSGVEVAPLLGEPSGIQLVISDPMPQGELPADLVPCMTTGKVVNAPEGGIVHIAVVTHGRVAVTTRTSPDPKTDDWWTALIPPHLVPPGRETPEFYEVRKSGAKWTLHACETRLVADEDIHLGEDEQLRALFEDASLDDR